MSQEDIQENKIFIVNFSELRGRLDPKISLYNRKVLHFAYPKAKLKALLLNSPQYGANESGISRKSNEEPRYIRITDIDENGLISTNELGATAEIVEDKYLLHENDILFARSGATVGKTYIHKDLPYKCFFAGYLIRFVIDPQIAIPDYVFIFTQLNIYKEWVNAIQRPSGQPNINAEEYQSLEIPLPDIKIQKKLVNIYLKSLSNKQQKEQEAKDLLNSIDDYLLSELGIERPSPIRTENGRFFYTSHKEVTGKRLDPLAYSERTKLLKQSITSGKYSCSTLKSLIIQESAGDWGIDVTDDYDESIYSKCLVLRSTEFNLYHNIVVDNSKAKYRLISNRKLDSIDLQPNDLIIEKSGGSENQPVGRIAIITKDLYERDRLCYSNFVQKIRLDNSQVIPTYACFFLRLVHNMRLTETMQSQTNGIRNLILSEYYNQQIPIPPIEKQKEIIYHIGTLYNRAKQLQHEATTILSDAKQEIEQMILA